VLDTPKTNVPSCTLSRSSTACQRRVSPGVGDPNFGVLGFAGVDFIVDSPADSMAGSLESIALVAMQVT
jgi:hypothetical protein